ncbi:hypothetical protein ACFPES_31330 [Paenibacillus sp. GCM10023248]|uniref:hypothetical protein n=1 Tax=unclassified Paenibacillus TaxID=185978 RepID=UPI0023789BA7|nr:hypothetical protein [Paenibacillus sp. MAHUQ-63]MDD9271535.1 hypothetical protein [Paenibacillus sp. MAHUQ-63]
MRAKEQRPRVFPDWCDTGGKTGDGDALRHVLDEDGGIVWDISQDKRLPHYDHIEMSGFQVSVIVSYGVGDGGELKLNRHAVFPGLRTIPNDTRGSLSHNFGLEASAVIKVDGQPVESEYPRLIRIRGFLEITSITKQGLEIVRKLMPAVDEAAVIEKVTIRNCAAKILEVEVNAPAYLHVTDPAAGVAGSYELRANLANSDSEYVSNNACYNYRSMEPGESHTYYCLFSAAPLNRVLVVNAHAEERKRLDLVEQWFGALRLETPDRTLNAAFNYAKLRGSESIFLTRNGLMHGPGGGDYYAALWTNDQCEYINPFFPFLGYEAGIEQSINGYSLYMNHMGPLFSKPLVSSLIAEGTDYWNGAGDRGDAAMYAYGAARFCMANGDPQVAEKLWPGIVWSLEYCRRQKNEHGVIRSDSDELENRFPSGEANLFTSCLVYDALRSTAMLAKAMGKHTLTVEKYYLEEAAELRGAIERYFAADVEGYATYRYYEGNDILRSWICVPLVMGLFERKEGTLQALFSPRLWTENGLCTQAGDTTFWDRATLYALRGVFAAGEPDLALQHLTAITRQRLLGEHVPYFVEAYPEGNQRQLSAESGLFARVFTEGLFGIRPTGFRSFTCNPQLPSSWQEAALRDVRAFGTAFDLEVSRTGTGKRLRVYVQGELVCDQQAGLRDEFRVEL